MSLVREDLISVNAPSTIFETFRRLSFVRDDSMINSFLESKRVILNGKIIFDDCVVNPGDNLILLTPQSLEPSVNSDYEVIFEDDCILVINKPAPLPVHPAGKYYFNSLTSILKRDRPNLNLFTVHRLDRETSGLIVFAKSKDVSQFLFNEFKSKFVKKTYFAIVHGIPNSFGFFSSPLVETSFGNIRDSVLPVSVGKLTKTEYELVSSSFDKKFSLLKLNPISGKKHQIRVHLSTAGFPIVGDKQYGFYPEKLNDYFLGVLSSQEILDLWLAPRHLLHCSSLSFKHPKSLKTVCFQSKITSDLVYFLNRAKFDL